MYRKTPLAALFTAPPLRTVSRARGASRRPAGRPTDGRDAPTGLRATDTDAESSGTRTVAGGATDAGWSGVRSLRRHVGDRAGLTWTASGDERRGRRSQPVLPPRCRAPGRALPRRSPPCGAFSLRSAAGTDPAHMRTVDQRGACCRWSDCWPDEVSRPVGDELAPTARTRRAVRASGAAPARRSASVVRRRPVKPGRGQAGRARPDGRQGTAAAGRPAGRPAARPCPPRSRGSARRARPRCAPRRGPRPRPGRRAASGRPRAARRARRRRLRAGQRNADDRQPRVGCDHAGQCGGQPGAGDGDAEAADLQLLGVFGHRLGLAVGGHHAHLVPDPALLELPRRPSPSRPSDSDPIMIPTRARRHRAPRTRPPPRSRCGCGRSVIRASTARSDVAAQLAPVEVDHVGGSISGVPGGRGSSPRAVTLSTRPPAVTSRRRARAVPAWMTSTPAGHVVEPSDLVALRAPTPGSPRGPAPRSPPRARPTRARRPPGRRARIAR